MDKTAEFKELIYSTAIEKKAFYRRGMRKGSSAFNRNWGFSCGWEEKIATALTAEQRKSLPEGMFGIPEQKRFPMPDKSHVYLAWRSVDKANLTEGEKVALRQKILSKAKALGIDTKGWSQR